MLDTCLVPTYKLAIRVNEKNIVERVDERYFGPSSLPNPNLEQKSFSSPGPKGGRSSTPLSSSLHSFPPPFRLLSPLPLSTPPPPRPWWRSPPYRLSAPAAWLAAAPPPLPPPSPSRAARSRPRPPGKVPMAAPSPSYLCCLWRMELRD